jgi:hypothetical protein
MNTSATTLLAALATTSLAAPALAFPVSTSFADLPQCDPLAGPDQLDELGFVPPFPVECSIVADSQQDNLTACPITDSSAVPNVIVRMTNTSGRAFSDVWYVGDEGTGFTNFDGTVNGFEAFKIDAVGGNRPLISESIAPNGIFEPGESWDFIVQDYGNAFGLPAHGFFSLGVPSGGAAGLPPVSAASIVALEVPAPGAVSLLAAAGLLARRRRA